MIPHKREWDRWGSRARVEYLAQLATLLTLFATVLFSAMAWREARQALALQRDIFAAQNAPRLVVAKVFVEDDKDDDQQYLNIIIKNVGESLSKSFCLRGERDHFKPMFSMCEKPFSDMVIPKNGTFRYIYPIRKDRRAMLGFKPKTAVLMGDDPVESRCIPGASEMIVVTLEHSDILGSKFGSLSQIRLCGDPLETENKGANSATFNRNTHQEINRVR